MEYSKVKTIQIMLVFFAMMLFFTVINNKVDYMMTPEVTTTRMVEGDLQINIDTNATIINGLVTFNLNMQKEALLQVGDKVQVEFVNGKYKMEANVLEKTFNPDSQTMTYTCELLKKETDIYEGQVCQIQFSYPLGRFDMVLPRECILYEDETTFVYYVETKNTITGKEHIVEKAEVNVIEEDDFAVAVSSDINERYTIVRNFSKPLYAGVKVRLEI